MIFLGLNNFSKEGKLDSSYAYSSAKIKKLHNPEKYGLDDSWYGGNIKYIAELRNSDLCLVVNKDFKTIDICSKNYESINMDILKKIAKGKNIEFDWKKTTKDEIVKLLEAE